MPSQSSKPRVLDERGASTIRKNFSEFFVSDKTDGFHATIAVYANGVVLLSFASHVIPVLRFEPSALNESCRKILNSCLEGEVLLSESSGEFVCFDCIEFDGEKQIRKSLLDRLKDAKQIVDTLESIRVETERFKSLDDAPPDMSFSCRVKKIFDVTRENVQRLADEASEGLVFTHAKKRVSYKWKKETTLDVTVAEGTRDCFVVDGVVRKIENLPDDLADGAVVEVVVRWSGKLSPRFSFVKLRSDKVRGNAPRTLTSSIKASRIAYENSITEILFDSLAPLVEVTKQVRSDLLTGILSQQRRGRDFRVLDLAGGNGAAIVPALRYETLLIDVDADAVRVARERCRKMDGAHDMVDSSFRLHVELAMRNAQAKSKSRFFVAEVKCVQTVVRKQRVNLTLKRNCNGEQFSAPTEQSEKFATSELCKTSLTKQSYDEIFILLQRHSRPTHEVAEVDTMDSFKLEGTEYCDMEFGDVKGGAGLALENGRRCLDFKTARKKKLSRRLSLCESDDAHEHRERRTLKMEIFRWNVCEGVVVELRHQKRQKAVLNFRAVVIFERSRFDFGRLDAAPAYDASVLAVLASLAGVKHAPFPKSLSFIVGDIKHGISDDSFHRRQYERRCRLIQCHNALHFFADKNSIETFCDTLKRFAVKGSIVFLSFYDGEMLMNEFNRVGGETLKFGLAEIQRIDTTQNGVAVGRVRFSLDGTRFAKRRMDDGLEFAVSPKKLGARLNEHGFALRRFVDVNVPCCVKFQLHDSRVIPGIYTPTPSNALSENPCSTSRNHVRLFDQLPASMRTFACMELAKFYKFFIFEYVGRTIAPGRRPPKRRKKIA